MAHHEHREQVTNAYIAFLKSPKIIDLMAAYLRDKDVFQINIHGNSSVNQHNYMGNVIEGNTYSVHFKNHFGEITQYFEKIARYITRGKVIIEDDEKSDLLEISDAIKSADDSELYFSVELNTEYQPYMQKSGKINCLIVDTKDGLGYIRDLSLALPDICEKLGIPIKNIDNCEEDFISGEFAVDNGRNSSRAEIYFEDGRIKQVPEIIKIFKELCAHLPTRKVICGDDYAPSDYEDYDCDYCDELYEVNNNESTIEDIFI